MSDPRRDIPSVDRLLGTPPFEALLAAAPRARIIAVLREVQNELRAKLENGKSEAQHNPEWYADQVEVRIAAANEAQLRRVINATGVVLHTNLGRAPLADEALAAINEAASGYSNLEYDLGAGKRGSRYDHCARLLSELTGCEDALVVNNNAAALVLALNTFAAGRAAIVSRGELVEIGGSFRVPEIMERSGAHLREVGATNRTHLADYHDALTDDTALILKVHRSNFQITGFAAEVSVAELRSVASESRVPLLFDLGSGLLFDLTQYGFPAEPRPQEALAAGADLVTMSGDKLLGGPQAGLILGKSSLVGAMRKNPLCRALRVDKLTLAALEATLRLYRDPLTARERIPALRMLTADRAALRARADALAASLRARGVPADVVDATSLVGGGAYPDFELPSAAVCIGAADEATSSERKLRAAKPPIVGRIINDRVALDVRTIDPADEEVVLRVVAGVFQS